MTKKLLASIAVVAAGAIGLTACGGKASSPAQAVPAGLRSDANQAGLQLTLTLSGNSSLFGTKSGLTAAQQQAILASSVVLAVHAASGSTLANPSSGGELSLALDHGGSTLAQLEVVGSNLYGNVDLPGLISTYHLPAGTVDKFQGELQKLAPQVPGLAALAAGKWVSVDLNQLNSFAQAAGITLPSLPQLVARLVSTFFDTLAQGSVSSTNGTTQVTISAPQLVGALSASLAQTLGSTPGLERYAGKLSDLEKKVPNRTANITVTTSGGRVSDLRLSLNQFDTSHKLTGPATLNLAVASAGAIQAPSGATPLNIAQLIHALLPSFSSAG